MIGEVAASALQALNRIHALAIEAEPGSLARIGAMARTEVLDAEARMMEIDH